MNCGTETDPGRHEQGLALVALILVLAVVAILAAVSAASGLAGPAASVSVVATARTTGCTEELRAVQTAMDLMMAANNLSAVSAQTAATNTFTALPIGTGSRPLAPTYLRQGGTRGSYTWTATGLVSVAATGGCT